MTIALPRLDRLPVEQRGITIGDFLVPIRISERLGTRVRHLVLVVLGALFVALSAQIYIPTQPVPFTGQTFGVLLVGGALGFRRGGMALSLYLVLGLFLPYIYSEGKSGLGTFVSMPDGALKLGPTGGYLIGFIAAAAITGRLAELGWDRRLIGAVAAMLIGNVVIYLFGLPWLAIVLSGPGGPDFGKAIEFGLTPFVVGDLLKLGLAGLAFPAAWWLVGRRPEDR